jgi:hypothetical protein
MSYITKRSLYPFFSYRGPSSDFTFILTDINTSGAYIFNSSIEQNELTGFNTANGTFTAPIKGLYYFNTHLCIINNNANSNDQGEWGYTIIKGGVTTTRYITDNPDYKSETGVEYNTRFSITCTLNVGDTVKVTATSFTKYCTYLQDQCYFTGHLIAGLS